MKRAEDHRSAAEQLFKRESGEKPEPALDCRVPAYDIVL
jgi:hypothetical protein